MRRIRVALLLVSVATLGLVALLAWRAQQGLALERAGRHEAVAERAFEEMERELTRILEREEERPFEHYAFYLSTSRERSPLAAGLEPWVVGAFQLGPDGAMTTPLEPGDPEAARARGDWPPDAKTSGAIARVRSVVDDLWSATDADGTEDAALLAPRLAKAQSERANASGEGEAQSPGTTRALSGPGVGSREERVPPDSALAEPKRDSAFEVLESLNRSAGDRAQRKQKVAEAPSAAVYGRSEAVSRNRDQPLEGESTAPGAPLVDDVIALEADDAFSEGSAGAPAEVAVPTELSSQRRRPGTVRIALNPMLGVAAGDALVLYRTVLVGQRGYRQGLVLDRAELEAWLEQQLMRSSGLARVATLRFDAAVIPRTSDDQYIFAHRFAEPFDALHAQLVLAALPGLDSPGALYALVAVLLAVGAAGLFAVHQNVSVTVRYAERRSNFVAAVTHELKTPLTAIRMYAEMLRDGLVPNDEKRQEYYGTITGESERLSRLVDNVLEFSKLEGGRRELVIAAGPVGPVLEEAAEKLAAHAAREEFTLTVRVAPDLPAVRFDRDALLQVLFNLVDNAMKYARTSDYRVVELETRREGEAVSVAVRDFGPGVARTHLAHVFEPFYRGESELTRTTMGTGIGLALVKELAERMGAAVSGANADGGGFRVCLAFPVAESI